ncbi:hypothetical protein QTG54_012875 [Skeletonema marinoi]|uniref:Uncharacterized protein n=1 Tax=Skeletonema marinoi TaxID=267567 RepID=A0AAD9D823_9STRA|nr:hypothetical protein QTG54_012875 [Skeletonema marinoi]
MVSFHSIIRIIAL